MSDYLKRTFRAQLTVTMDSVLRRAVFEIMTVFENSIHDHQMELAQKGEEVAQLKIKLQAAELKLRELECGGDGGVEVTEVQRQPAAVQSTPGQTPGVPEIDFEVPDDWCAPLGCETVTKKDEGVCPSVRLRPLSIPLWHIPIIKQEGGSYRIDSNQQIKDLRRSKRVSLSNEKHNHTQDRSTPLREQGPRRLAVRSDKKFLQDMRQEYSGGLGLRRGRNIIGKEQENTVKTREKEKKIEKNKSTKSKTEKNADEKTYTCKFCKKVFNTPFGRNVHVRSHRRCRGCKKEFPFPSVLKHHKSSCEKLKKLLAKQALNADDPNSESCEETVTSPSEKEVIIKKEDSPSSSSHKTSSVHSDGFTKMHRCTQCNKTFHMRYKLKQHMRLHTSEKLFSCSVCPKKFHNNQALKIHVTRIHKDQMNSSDANGRLAWTKPLEDIEDNRDQVISPSSNAKRAIIHNNSPKVCNPKWQSMGLQNPNGFICLLCQKFVKTKYQLIEHFRLHTGEKPIKCENCPGKFRTCAQLYQHKKQYHYSVTLTQCEKCEKKFPSQASYNKHVTMCQKDWPLVCKVCGKGFCLEGRLKNHMERCHR